MNCSHGKSKKLKFPSFQWAKKYFNPLRNESSLVYLLKTPEGIARHRGMKLLSCPINWNIKEIYGLIFDVFCMINWRHFLYFRTLNRVNFIVGRWCLKGCLRPHNFYLPVKSNSENFSSFLRFLWLPHAITFDLIGEEKNSVHGRRGNYAGLFSSLLFC